MLDEVRTADQISQDAQQGVAEKRIQTFRQILLWPIQLVPENNSTIVEDYAAILETLGPDNPWYEIADEFTGDPKDFQQRHYSEFVTFLPPVQRLLYGSGRGKPGSVCAESPIKAFRRSDVAKIRITLSAGAAPLELDVTHIDLYFFYEIDVAILAFEVHASDLPLVTVQDLMFRLGRTYPAYWEENGSGGHCPDKVEFIGDDGGVLAVSDHNDQAKFLAQVCLKRAARVASHWQFLLHPLVPHHSDLPGQIRYKQLEYSRMPQMDFLAASAGTALTRADYVRLAFASGPGSCDELPFSESHLTSFESAFCYDRYYGQHNGVEWPESRYMSCGHTLVVTGNADNPFFTDINHGCQNSFRHEHFLVFLLAHFHKAALLMFSDQLTEAMSRLDAHDKSAVLSFRMASRRALETFLRFTHRYWFHSVSNQTQARELFTLCRTQLELDRLYDDIRQEIQEMSEFLENEALRRQNDTMTRLTVVTTLGLIGTTVTGFLGMNVLAWADEPLPWRIWAFLAVLIPTILLTLLTIVNSRSLSNFMERLSDTERTKNVRPKRQKRAPLPRND
ncbi:MAG: hypothetical protein J0H37_08665 [Hyphomicrobium denitrificans]|nr:hypothetical protein [Hyphomicrobium denitrificans]